MKTNLMEIVNQIPVDQSAPANVMIKRLILEKVRLIFRNKEVIEKETKQQKRKQILDAYKKSIGFEKKSKELNACKGKLDNLRKGLISMGLNEEGDLLTVNRDSYYGDYAYTGNERIQLNKETVEKIKKVKALLEAVEGEMQPFSRYDQLESRLMMASTVGEVMAIINAVAGENIFQVKTELLGLPEPTKKEPKQ